jgi:DNA-binding transcriptional ArsR family regulator
MENYLATLDPVFHALADPTRRSVVQRLGQGAATVSDLARPFAISLPTFLKHVTVLEEAGLISTRKVGRVRSCALNPGRLAAAERWFEEQRAVWQGRYRNLDALIETKNGDQDDA